MPCCWIGNHPKYGMLKEFLGEDFSQLDAVKNDTDSIESSRAMQRIRESWDLGTLQPCVDFCGEPFNQDENHWRDGVLYVYLGNGDASDG